MTSITAKIPNIFFPEHLPPVPGDGPGRADPLHAVRQPLRRLLPGWHQGQDHLQRQRRADCRLQEGVRDLRSQVLRRPGREAAHHQEDPRQEPGHDEAVMGADHDQGWWDQVVMVG